MRSQVWWWTHVIQKFLQVLLQLKEVDGRDETLLRFGQAVSGQLDDLVVDKAQDPVGQRQNALGTIWVHEITQPALHLRRGLARTNYILFYNNFIIIIIIIYNKWDQYFKTTTNNT